MKITMTLLTFFALFSPITRAQESTQMNLPAGAVGRLGKGSFNEIQYSPDGARLAVATSIGIWLYDTMPLREVALFAGRHKGGVLSVAFSPDGRVLASGHGDGRIRLWDAKTGKLKRMLTGHNGRSHERSVQAGWRYPCQWRCGQGGATVECQRRLF